MAFGELFKETATKAIYRFNGDLLLDSSGNGMPLINLGSGVTLTNQGFYGQGADFGASGNNGKYLYNNSNLNGSLSNDITITFCVILKSQPTSPNRRLLDYRTGTAYLLVDYQFTNNAYNIRAACNGIDANKVITLSLNRKYYITITITTAGAVSLYLDSALIATGTRAPAVVGNTYYLGNCLLPANFNNGAIYDENHIIQRLKSQQEIQKQYTYSKGWF